MAFKKKSAGFFSFTISSSNLSDWASGPSFASMSMMALSAAFIPHSASAMKLWYPGVSIKNIVCFFQSV